MTTKELSSCPICGRKYLFERHVELCRENRFRGSCPMCGEEYDSFTNHLQVCQVSD